jgi:hypothetical protein
MLAGEYYVIIHKNPFVGEDIIRDGKSPIMNGKNFVKMMAVIGALMIAMARGKIQYDEQTVGI